MLYIYTSRFFSFADVRVGEATSSTLALRGEKRGHSYFARLEVSGLAQAANELSFRGLKVTLFWFVPPYVRGAWVFFSTFPKLPPRRVVLSPSPPRAGTSEGGVSTAASCVPLSPTPVSSSWQGPAYGGSPRLHLVSLGSKCRHYWELKMLQY